MNINKVNKDLFEDIDFSTRYKATRISIFFTEQTLFSLLFCLLTLTCAVLLDLFVFFHREETYLFTSGVDHRQRPFFTTLFNTCAIQAYLRPKTPEVVAATISLPQSVVIPILRSNGILNF